MSRKFALSAALLLSALAPSFAQEDPSWPPVERGAPDDPQPAPEPEPEPEPEPSDAEREARARAERLARERAEAELRDRAGSESPGAADPLSPGASLEEASPRGEGPAEAVPTEVKPPELGILGGFVALEVYPWVVTDVEGAVERERQRLGLSWRLRDDLDVEDEVVGQVYSVEVRFTPLLSVVGEYLRVRPSGEVVLDESNLFNGRPFVAGERVKTEIDFQQVRVDASFGWSSDVFTVGALVGVRQFFVTTRVESRDRATRSRSQTRLTSPELGARLEVHVGDPEVFEFGCHLRTAFFVFPEIDANGYEAAWFDFDTGIQASFFGIFKVQAGLRYLSTYLRTDHGGDEEKAELHLFGPVAGVSVLF